MINIYKKITKIILTQNTKHINNAFFSNIYKNKIRIKIVRFDLKCGLQKNIKNIFEIKSLF